MTQNFILALYDFASKQEYIYRTNKIKEISGASALLAGMYKKLFDEVLKNVKYELDRDFSLSEFENSDCIAQVLYDGGGNLMVLFKSEEEYKAANQIISVYLLKNAPGLSLIASHVEFSGADRFVQDREKLHKKANPKRKNQYPSITESAVLPITQIDPLTFMPITKKLKFKEIDSKGNEVLIEESLSADRDVKRDACPKNESNNIDDLQDGMLAVIYVDGNAMGEHLKKAIPDKTTYDEGVKRLRNFSKNVNNSFVIAPTIAINKFIESQEDNGFRQVIAGGDETTIICNAKVAYDVMNVYFKALDEANKERKKKDSDAEPYYACAGIAIFHAKSPFTIAYEMAEAACESAKKKSRKNQGNYFDFYYCHAGIVSDFETLREREEQMTNRPYSVDDAICTFEKYIPVLQEVGRGNVKALGTAARKGIVEYKTEAKRVNAYLGKSEFALGTDNEIENEARIIFDMSEFYDLWFSKKDEEEE